ncbi:MAG: hypothetical protein WCP33_03255 [Deltaproteobacteria bacterium]
MSQQFFGQYLVENGVITSEQLANALGMQEFSNCSFGEIANRMGILSSEEIIRINRLQQTEDLLFGEAAIQLGLLSVEQEKVILASQKENHLFIGEALTATGCISAEQLVKHLNNFEQVQNGNKTSGLDIPHVVPFPELCRCIGELSHKILSRVARIKFKPDVCEVATKIDGNNMAIIIEFTGDVSFSYIMTFPRQIRSKIAIEILNTNEYIFEKRSLDSSVLEFARIICDTIISKAQQIGIRLVMLHSDLTDHDEDITVPNTNICLLLPAYLPTSEWIDIALIL